MLSFITLPTLALVSSIITGVASAPVHTRRGLVQDAQIAALAAAQPVALADAKPNFTLSPGSTIQGEIKCSLDAASGQTVCLQAIDTTQGDVIGSRVNGIQTTTFFVGKQDKPDCDDNTFPDRTGKVCVDGVAFEVISQSVLGSEELPTGATVPINSKCNFVGDSFDIRCEGLGASSFKAGL